MRGFLLTTAKKFYIMPCMTIYYTGVGSRETPTEVCDFLQDVAVRLSANYVLRSGGAVGADAAFESGVLLETAKEIWVPYVGFRGHKSKMTPSKEAFAIAKSIHPAWDRLNNVGKALHARNCHQVLGISLNEPSKFLLCWTPQGQIKGGTATAIKLALNNNIPILNFGKWSSVESMRDAFEDFLIFNGE